jgi:bifunctional UDP-N-acetylglucosamine pyrophosphorylase/glucosamine-1-phosphate N-acetyltransferase
MKKNIGLLGAIILAAGKGKRMNSKRLNKVVLHLADKPMILHTFDLLKAVSINLIVVVVGFAKESVMKLLGENVLYAEQKKRLGTAHAVSVALKKLPIDIKHVLVLNGDDSAFYNKTTLKKLIQWHFKSDSAFTLLTIEKDNPEGLGRIIRDSYGKVIAIVEEKDATVAQRKIKEINPACYLFKVDFLKRYIKKVKKSSVTNEYYLTDLIRLGVLNKEKIESHRMGSFTWRGVNTEDELSEAENLFNSLKKQS